MTVHTIHPRAVYTLGSAREALGLKPSTLPREIRLHRLRAAKRGGKVLILGAWLLAWIEGEWGRLGYSPVSTEAPGAPERLTA